MQVEVNRPTPVMLSAETVDSRLCGKQYSTVASKLTAVSLAQAANIAFVTLQAGI